MAKNGIILAGGTGSRLAPLTSVVNKHLLDLNGKFIIDYPIDTLKQLGCQDVTVILGGNHFSQVVGYLGDGSRYGMNFNYVYQPEPKGIAHAISLCERFVRDDVDFSVILGDNVFEKAPRWNNPNWKTHPRAQIMLANHPSLTRFGVASIDDNNKIVKIEEKPKSLDPQFTNMAISGCYLFTPVFFEYFKELKPSARGEYEITDIIRKYLEADNLHYSMVNGLWSDAGTHESISYVNHFFYQKEHGITQM
jgi:glucose-1-phosphate thymidylyltransferase